MTTVKEVLQKCTVEGNVVKLPSEQLDKKLYGQVKTALEKIGGKWKGGKVFGFEFKKDPTELLEEIASGVKRNIKKELQFFPTPPDIAEALVGYARLTDYQLDILEPSAGHGALIKAIQDKLPNAVVYYAEISEENREEIDKIGGTVKVANDFMELEPTAMFDRIIANPPFAKNQDIDHVMKMWEHLRPGGRLVSIMSSHWKTSRNKKEMAFKKWIVEVGAALGDIKEGGFKSAGTMVATVVLIADKKK